MTDTSTQIQALTLESAQKSKIIIDLKSYLEKIIEAKKSVRRDEKLEEFSEKVIKEKEMLIENQKREIIDLTVSDIIL